MNIANLSSKNFTIRAKHINQFRGNSQKRAEKTTNRLWSSRSCHILDPAPSHGATEVSWWRLPSINMTSTRWRRRNRNLERRAKIKIKEISIQEEFWRRALTLASSFSNVIISNETKKAAQSSMEHGRSFMRMALSSMALIRPFNRRASSSVMMHLDWSMKMQPSGRLVKRPPISWPISWLVTRVAMVWWSAIAWKIKKTTNTSTTVWGMRPKHLAQGCSTLTCMTTLDKIASTTT